MQDERKIEVVDGRLPNRVRALLAVGSIICLLGYFLIPVLASAALMRSQPR